MRDKPTIVGRCMQPAFRFAPIGLSLLLCVAGCGDPQRGTGSQAVRPADQGRGHADVQAIAVILPPMIDGKLEEGIWRHTPGYSDFVALGGEPRPPLRRTEFRIAYDAANLYVALSCEIDASIGIPKARHWQDDDEGVSEDESCRIVLWPDPAPAGVYYEVAVNAEGVVCDARRHWGWPLSSTGWNAPVQVAVAKSVGAWHAELQMPLKWLGIPDRPWHINVIRNDTAANERSSLAPPPTTSAAGRPALAILRWPVPALPLVTGPLPIRQLIVDDMETSTPARRTLAATVSTSDLHMISGRRSLQLDYKQSGGAVSWSLRHNDFSGWQVLRFGIFVDGASPIDMGVRLRDVFGRASTMWFLARPGSNDVILPLDLLGVGLLLRNIKTLDVLSRAPATVWIDHVRLVEDTLSHHERPHRPERPSRSSLAISVDPRVVAGAAPTPLAVDGIVPLFGTRKVRRLQYRTATPAWPVTFEPEALAGHDLRDPLRVFAFFRHDRQGYLACREVRLEQMQEEVVLGPDDFPQLPGDDVGPDAR
jgi:hypothetical protein